MRDRFRDVEHLIRVAGLVVVGFIVFVAARAIFVPRDFGEYGHFRTGAMDDNRAREPVFAGRAACLECHDEAAAAAAGSAHSRVHCEACHGAQGAHAADPATVVPERPDAGTMCLRCHRAAEAKPAWFAQVEPEEHAAGEACNACHVPHHPEFD